MMKEQLNILEQIAAFDRGEYNSPDVHTQIKAGWYDWFCSDETLVKKTKLLYGKVKQLIKTRRIRQLDLTKVYVWFKNNCPVYGNLYDDIRIADIETGEVLFTIVPRSGYDNTEAGKHAEVHGNRLTPDGEFQHNAYRGTWRGLIKFLDARHENLERFNQYIGEYDSVEDFVESNHLENKFYNRFRWQVQGLTRENWREFCGEIDSGDAIIQDLLPKPLTADYDEHKDKFIVFVDLNITEDITLEGLEYLEKQIKTIKEVL